MEVQVSNGQVADAEATSSSCKSDETVMSNGQVADAEATSSSCTPDETVMSNGKVADADAEAVSSSCTPDETAMSNGQVADAEKIRSSSMPDETVMSSGQVADAEETSSSSTPDETVIKIECVVSLKEENSENGKTLPFIQRHKRTIWNIVKGILLVGYFVYFAAAMLHAQDQPWSEGKWRLVVITVVGVLLLVNRALKTLEGYLFFWGTLYRGLLRLTAGRSGKVTRWVLYLGSFGFMVVYVVLNVAMKKPKHLQSLIGLAVFPLLLFLYSNNRKRINWHTVYWGMTLQFVMALLILKTPFGAFSMQWAGDRLTEFLDIGSVGSTFIFGKSYRDHSYAFGATVQVFVMTVAISVLTYYGVIKFIVNTVGKVLSFCLQTSPVEGINAVGNIFLHVPESVLLVQEYLSSMTPSKLFVTYSGSLATVGGVALIIFMTSGIPAAPLVAASAMSAPAALAASKLVFPSVTTELLASEPDEKDNQKSIIRHPKSLPDAIFLGINQSVKIVVNIISYIMTFYMIIEFINRTLSWFGSQVGHADISVGSTFAYVFYPFSFMMGARHEDCLFIGELLGVRTFSFAIVAYTYLGPVVLNGAKFREYVSESPNNTWSYNGTDIILNKTNETLAGGIIDARSEIIATYALCGSASFPNMGFIIGVFSAIIPHRKGEVTQHILRAMIVGTVASYFTACFAGLLYDE